MTTTTNEVDLFVKPQITTQRTYNVCTVNDNMKETRETTASSVNIRALTALFSCTHNTSDHVYVNRRRFAFLLFRSPLLRRSSFCLFSVSSITWIILCTVQFAFSFSVSSWFTIGFASMLFCHSVRSPNAIYHSIQFYRQQNTFCVLFCLLMVFKTLWSDAITIDGVATHHI